MTTSPTPPFANCSYVGITTITEVQGRGVDREKSVVTGVKLFSGDSAGEWPKRMLTRAGLIRLKNRNET